MLPFLIPILETLASNGLGMLAGAIQAKGKAVIEDKLGVKIPNDPAALTPELLQQLKMKEMEHEEFLINAQTAMAKAELQAEVSASEEVTKRWQADMSSDSWLAKNIRPMTLIFILCVYTLFALLSAAHINVTQSYVELLGQWGMLIMSAYFVGRTVEKVITTKEAKS